VGAPPVSRAIVTPRQARAPAAPPFVSLTGPFVPGHPLPSGVGRGRRAELAGLPQDPTATISGAPDLPTITREVGSTY
jgi:hypothetical protein